ncbi:MAG: M14 family metallopeptidase, partial [Bacteroidota bacterium]
SFIAIYPCVVLAQLQSPKDFLGYELGEKFTRYHQVVSYFDHIDQNTEQVKLVEYGKTYEDRPLILAFVSSKENIEKLESIRTDNLKRAGILSGTPSENVGVVWLSYNVHGNEASATEASIATIYELIKEGSDKSDWLKNTLVIIDPCINPDGRERYVNFYWENGNLPFNPDPNSIEHFEREPWGRSNHYLFDLNRDWAWQTQIETQQRLKIYNQWLPQIHADFHEQFFNSPYYFAPAAQPFHELITPFQRDFQVEIGKNHARYFDANNWFYFTKEFFDLLYPSYGDTYPTYSGAIGMTYEQAGHSRAGLGIIKQEGDTLTLKDRLIHHHTTGLSTIEVASKNNDRLLTEFEKFFGDHPGLKYKTFVLKFDGNHDAFNQLKKWLDAHDIIYGTTSEKGSQGFDYFTGKKRAFTTRAEDLIINTNQPKATLAHVLFEPRTKLIDSISYDLTAWSIPYAYGIQAYATEQLIPVTPSTVTPFSKNTPGSPYAYVSKWTHLKDARFLSGLLKNNIKVRFTHRSISFDRNYFDRGSLIIAKRDNLHLGKDFDDKVVSLANKFERSLTPLPTGFMNAGPDIGSSSVRYLNKPKIAMLKGDDVSSLSSGAVWHYLEQELKYPLTILGTQYLNEVNLSGYDVLILPNGGYRSFGKVEMKKLVTWVENGGKLIVMQGALNAFKDRGHTSLSSASSEAEKKEIEKKEESRKERLRLIRFEDRERESAKRLTQAIFRVHLDNSHPLAFGYQDTYFTLKTRPGKVAYLNDGNVGIVKGENSLISGFAGQYVREDVANTLAFGVENKGQGSIIYFIDDPLFRAFWESGKLLFANALFFVGQ